MSPPLVQGLHLSTWPLRTVLSTPSTCTYAPSDLPRLHTDPAANTLSSLRKPGPDHISSLNPYLSFSSNATLSHQEALKQRITLASQFRPKISKPPSRNYHPPPSLLQQCRQSVANRQSPWHPGRPSSVGRLPRPVPVWRCAAPDAGPGTRSLPGQRRHPPHPQGWPSQPPSSAPQLAHRDRAPPRALRQTHCGQYCGYCSPGRPPARLAKHTRPSLRPSRRLSVNSPPISERRRRLPLLRLPLSLHTPLDTPRLPRAQPPRC